MGVNQSPTLHCFLCGENRMATLIVQECCGERRLDAECDPRGVDISLAGHAANCPTADGPVALEEPCPAV